MIYHLFITLFSLVFLPFGGFTSNVSAEPVVAAESFVCSSMFNDFAFQYPVPAGWAASIEPQEVVGDAALARCTITWKHDEFGFDQLPTATVEWKVLPTPVNEDGAPYKKINNTTVEFYEPNAQVSLTTHDIPDQDGLNNEMIMQTAIDSFVWK